MNDNYCDTCESELENNSCPECEYVNFKKSWFDKHSLNANSCLSDIPINGLGEFYFRLEKLGNKRFVKASKEKEVIEWMRLTEKLFL